MSRKIEEELNLPRLSDALRSLGKDNKDLNSNEVERITNCLSKIDKNDLIFQEEDGTKEHVKEMDDIYSYAMKAYQDTLDLSFNMEPKNSGTVLSSSTVFLDIALKASKSKSEQRLKMLKLRMDREKHESSLKINVQEAIIQSDGDGFVADRRDMIREIRESINTKDKR